MYLLQKNYETIVVPQKSHLVVVAILPSSPDKDINRFKQLIQEVIRNINQKSKEPKWELKILSQDTEDRSPSQNYSTIYGADIVIAECSEKKANVFYMVGLAHAFGRPVCSCYREKLGQRVDIPFNVHGRQSLTYSISTVSKQKAFQNKLKEWIKKYEQD